MRIKRGRSLLIDKRAEDSDILFPAVIFIVVNILFFSGLIFFVFNASSGALVYEQAYAKEIALALDKAKPNTDISLDFTNGYELSEKNNLKEPVVLIDKNNNEVIVKLSSKAGHSYKYFTDYDASVSFSRDKNQVIIHVA